MCSKTNFSGHLILVIWFWGGKRMFRHFPLACVNTSCSHSHVAVSMYGIWYAHIRAYFSLLVLFIYHGLMFFLYFVRNSQRCLRWKRSKIRMRRRNGRNHWTRKRSLERTQCKLLVLVGMRIGCFSFFLSVVLCTAPWLISW